ncbi:Protein phosphatase 1G [Nymphon striatum]|nr:Protein phosphatase 1G [Nymphon striatum]
MGNYLNAPVIDKESIDEESDKLSYGASSMQGWRTDQEDAHNCILNFDVNSSLFAVYDGHGGLDVSNYCSLRLPDFIKSVSDYKKGKISEALENGFLEFDLTLKTSEVRDELAKIGGTSELLGDHNSEDDVHELLQLRKESDMPIQKLMERYKGCTESLNKSSPMLKAKKDSVNGVINKSGIKFNENQDTDDTKDPNSSNCVSVSEKIDSEHCESSSKVSNGIDIIKSSSDESNEDEGEKDSEKQKEIESVPGCSSSSSSSSSNKESEPSSSSSSGPKPSSRLRPKEAVMLLDSSEEDEGSNSDEEYDENNNGSEEEEEEEPVSKLDDEDSEESEETSEDDEDADDDDDEDDEDVINHLRMPENQIYKPAEDSGCTAVLALIKDSMLYVANVGDSRCIVCRKGIAVEMSCDHKPEDAIESARIKAAGGHVTAEGRVNGGLNLSRALGDHLYKQGDIPAKEQMISAQPDIQTLCLNSDDEFMVVACDGIWNSMSSQEVVNFVKKRILKATKLSKICEEMFMHCLAPDSAGDGTGCDNMTAVIVKFKPALCEESGTLKRKINDSPEHEDPNSKKVKTE